MLTDRYLRKHDYLRISITDRCNLRCFYCVPPEGITFLTHDDVLRNEEFAELIRIFVNMGVKKVRFTGGEPLIRKGFIGLIEKTREQFPDLELCLTTNGVLIEKYVNDLHRLRVDSLNISLDTINRERYKEITGVDAFDSVIRGIERVLSIDSFNLKINAVLLQETIDDLDEYLDFFKDKNVAIRFIERMPFTEKDMTCDFLKADALVEEFMKRGSFRRNEKIDTSVSLMYDFDYKGKYPMKIGIIPPMTHKFCSRCNRLRLTSDGKLKTCLLARDEFDLKTPLRNHEPDSSIQDIILAAMKTKGDGHHLDCYSSDAGCSSLRGVRGMSRTGG